jgi:3-hydroxybutyryl-CoA dehydrogenase
MLSDVKTIGVVGAGQMGGGIGQVCATGGYRVLLVDVAEPRLDHALENIHAGLEKAVNREALARQQVGAILARIEPTTALDRLHEAQVVIEAVPENLPLKQQLMAELNRVCPASVIFASNTSSISLTKLGVASGRPDRVIGMHFMNPVPVMRLVEVICGRDTGGSTRDLIRELAGHLGKIAVVARDMPGFIVNRILMPMINEAILELEAGVASAEDIDLAMTAGTGHPMGPLALADRIGLDTVLAICEILAQDLGDPKFRPSPLLRRHVEAGRLGRKTGKGFYRYGDEAMDRQGMLSGAPSRSVRSV